MYGKRKYGRTDKPTDKPIDDSSIPTFMCPRCKGVKTIDMPHIEITALEKDQLFLYTKVCGACAKLLQDWMKG